MTRHLVVCCDGTWNTPQQKDRGVNVPSNVVKMARAVVDENPEQQIIYYDTGIGTGTVLDRLTGGALGLGLTENIKDAYAWIARNLKDGDRLFLFGFSRGAYTVRSLAGLIGRCGVVREADKASIDQAYELYRKASDDVGRLSAAAFKATQRGTDIWFLGVWDTVGSLGVPALSRYGLLRKMIRHATDGTSFAHGFHDETLSKHVLHAYHAIGIDEQRGPFEPALWKQAPGEHRENAEQVWFAGVHCNIGGGYADSGLSDHCFMWMAAKASDAGLRLDHRYLAMRVDPNAHGEMRDEYDGFYRLVPRHVRKPGAEDTLNEKFHVSVLRRKLHPTNAYAPENLPNSFSGRLTDDGLSMIETLRQQVYGTPTQQPVPQPQDDAAPQRSVSE